jgi:Flp pilus assembly protein TadD
VRPPARTIGIRWIACTICLAGTACLNAPRVQATIGDPHTATLLNEAAVASRKDDHAAAIAAYRAVIQIDPALRDSVGLGLASQLTWSGRYDEAIAELEWILSRHPDRVDARFSLALAQSWSGRTKDALETYRKILLIDPANRDASLGEARMLSWLGRPAEAIRLYEKLVDRDPDFADGWIALAQAQNWAGRADLALRSLASLDKNGRATDGSRGMERDIRGAWVHRVTTSADFSNDSDRFHASSIRLEVETPLRYRGRLRFGTVQGRFSKAGEKTRFEHGLSVSNDVRIATPLWITGSVQLQTDRPAGTEMSRALGIPTRANYTPLTGGLSAVWNPADRWRVDAGLSRFAIFTYEMYPDRITGWQYGAGVTWQTPFPPTFVIAGDRAVYSDDNDRVNLRSLLRWVPRHRNPRVSVEGGTAYQDSRRWTGHGIWNPDRSRAHFGRLDLEQEIHPGVVIRTGIDTGWGREGGSGPFRPYAAYGGALIVQGHGLRIEGNAGHSGPYERARNGYRRTYGALMMGVAW